jgi:GTP cyclohydrolase I
MCDEHKEVSPHLEETARELLSNIFHPFWEGRKDVDKTPKRFVQMLQELAMPKEFEFTTFETENDEMVIVQDIPFVSLCAHHIAPFMGKAHIAYVPNKVVAGLSKFVRATEYMSKGLWSQEELNVSLANYLTDHLEPKGLAVIMQAEHTCMTIRGVRTHGSLTTTSTMLGCFADHNKLARQEFLSIIGLGGRNG